MRRWMREGGRQEDDRLLGRVKWTQVSGGRGQMIDW